MKCDAIFAFLSYVIWKKMYGRRVFGLDHIKISYDIFISFTAFLIYYLLFEEVESSMFQNNVVGLC